MFCIFDPIMKRVKSFEEYLEYMFKHEKIHLVGLSENEEKVTLWDLMRCDLILLTCRNIIQSNYMMVHITVHGMFISKKELCDISKASATYLTAIQGTKNFEIIS
jgi:hypothetical protein